MNSETVHSVKEKSMYRNALQLNTDIKERTNEEGLMNHRKGKKKKKRKKKQKKKEREREICANIKASMQLRFKKQNKKETNNGIVKTFIHTSIPIHTPCTLLKH